MIDVYSVAPGLELDPDTPTPLAEGATRTVMMNLSRRPTDDVTVEVSSSDTGELTVSPASLVFTDANWNTAQPSC